MDVSGAKAACAAIPAMGWARAGVFAQAGHVASQSIAEALLAEAEGRPWELGGCGGGGWHKGADSFQGA